MKYLSKIKNSEIDKKVVLLRLDFNIQDNEIHNSLRIIRSLPTILFILGKGSKVIILSHRGRPKNKSKSLSLKKISDYLSKLIGQRIHFINHFDFKKIKEEIRKSPSSSVFFLENLRFHPGEESNNLQFAKNLASLGDIYVNDAFSVSHRDNASVIEITRFIPSYCGLEMESEIETFNKILKNPKKPLILILGGAKAKDKIEVIKKFHKNSQFILIGGGTANTFFLAKNIPIGKSLADKNALLGAKKWISDKKIILPIDTINQNGSIFDIGPQTINLFSKIIKEAKTIVWNGPMGFSENKKYQKGTLEILKAISKSKAYSIIGGGETTSFAIENKMDDKISYLSVGGGAMIEYLSGKKIPGIKALK